MTNSAPEVLPEEVQSLWWLLVLFGLVTLAVGVFFVASPHETLKVFTVIAGIVLVVDGVIAVVGSIVGVRENRGLLALVGVLSVVAGIVLIKKPFTTLVVLALIVGLWLVVVGGVRLVASFRLREDRAVSIVLSLVEVAAGVVIVSWPELGLSTLAVIIGIVLIIRGVLLTYEGWVLRKLGRDLTRGAASTA
jgi:uncharacterized membrane protein HdeD (DUF308 family)